MAKSRKQPVAIPTEVKPDYESEVVAAGVDPQKIVGILESYRNEAEYARYSGPNSRDQTWLQNLDLYWNRFDFSKKAAWQAREVMPELPQYVDRFAAAMRTALISSERFFTVTAAGDEEGDLAAVIRKVMITQLRRVGRSPTGHPVDFLNTFEEIMKFGALMMNACMVIPKTLSDGQNYTAIDVVDPYNIWLDPTGRGLYRIRRIEMDLHELLALGELKDNLGERLYNEEALQSAASSVAALMITERERRTGTGQWTVSYRKPVILHEYYCTLVDETGKVLGTNVLCVVANNAHLIRGPEKNPFWHQKDWVLTSPIITVPLSPYGRGYVENFASIAKTFNEMTNLLLDGVFTSALKAFAVVPSMLEDPGQIEEGVYPNVVFRLQEGSTVDDFMKEINLGSLPNDALQMWASLKKEMQEGAAFNELTLGQLAPKGRTSATEIGTADQNSNSYIRSIASNIETLFLEPMLDLLWQVTIQHLSAKDTEIKAAIGETWFATLLASKKEFAKYKFTFVARGISSLILKQQKFQGLMQMLQVVGSNQMLAQKFLQEVDPQKILDLLFDLLDVEKDRLAMSPRDQQMQQIEQMQQQIMQVATQGAGGAGGKPPPSGPGGSAPMPQGAPQPSQGSQGGQAVPPGAGVPAAAQAQGIAPTGG